jgi:hypothetical protein
VSSTCPWSCEILIFLQVGGRAHQQGSSGIFFWKDDIRRMAEKLEEYREAVRQCKPGAIQALEDFVQDRRDSVEDIMTVRIK